MNTLDTRKGYDKKYSSSRNGHPWMR